MRNPLTRSMSALAAAALVATAAPAVALADVVPDEATASVDVHDIAAGTADAAFTVTVTHPSPVPLAAEPIDLVVVALPPGLATAVGAAGPDGWTADLLDNGRAVELSGGELAGGESADFSVTADIGRPATDATGSWRVATSTDGGQSLTTATPTEAGALDTDVRVLAVTGLHVVDDSVTEGQGGIKVRATVTNAGSAALVVDTAVDVDGDGVTVTPLQQTTIDPESALDVDFIATAVEPGKFELSASASASGADGFEEATTTLTVLEQPGAEYDDLFEPGVVTPGQTADFKVGINPTGEVSATLDLARSTLSFPDLDLDLDLDLTAPLTSPGALDGEAGATTLSFESVTVPLDAPGGSYTGEVHLAGTDENGNAVDLTVSVADPLVVDTDAPAVTPILTAPAPMAGDEPALFEGAEAALGGDVADEGAAACSDCTVTGAHLRQLDADGAPVGMLVPVTVAVDGGGTLAGSHTVDDLAAGAEAVELVVEVVDAAGRSGLGASEPVDVDTTPPTIDAFRTTSGGDGTGVDVELTEPVVLLDPQGEAMPIPAVDFACDGHVVLDAELDAADARVIHLTLAEEIGADETPTCHYQPVSQRLRDRVGLVVTDTTMAATDGIAPGIPVVGTVDGREATDGVFATNRSAPVVGVGDVADGDVVEVFEDADGDDVLDDSDVLVGSVTSAGSTVDVPLDDLGTIERTLTLLVRSTDSAGNVGYAGAHDLVLDFTRPTFETAELCGDTITVTVSEDLATGTDEARDWRIAATATADGTDVVLFVAAVTRTDAVITLTIEDGYDSAIHDIVAVRHAKRDEVTRYADRAGNTLLDGEVSVVASAPTQTG